MSTQIAIVPQGLARLRAMLLRLSKTQRGDMLDAIGVLVTHQTTKRITKEKSGPNNEIWPPLSSDYYIKKLFGAKDFPASSGGLLELRHRLRESIQHVVEGDQVEIGSNLEYAATHQYGDQRLAWGKVNVKYPPRPFLGLSKDNEDEIEKTVSDWVQETLGLGTL